MRTRLARIATISLVILIVGGCSPAPSTSPSPTSSTAASSARAPSAAATPGPSAAERPQSTYTPIETALWPVRGSARELGMQVQTAPGPDGTLLITIPTARGIHSGDPRQGREGAPGMAGRGRRRDTMRPASSGLGWQFQARLHADQAQRGHAQPDRRLRVRCELAACSPAGPIALDGDHPGGADGRRRADDVRQLGRSPEQERRRAAGRRHADS